jgi:predicted ArsR family transcriptional regulator
MSLADDCEVVLRTLLDEGPLTLDDLRERCGFAAPKVNALLGDLSRHGQVIFFRQRVNGRKITRYSVKETAR